MPFHRRRGKRGDADGRRDVKLATVTCPSSTSSSVHLPAARDNSEHRSVWGFIFRSTTTAQTSHANYLRKITAPYTISNMKLDINSDSKKKVIRHSVCETEN